MQQDIAIILISNTKERTSACDLIYVAHSTIVPEHLWLQFETNKISTQRPAA